MPKGRTLKSDKTSMSIRWSTKDELDLLRQKKTRYEGKEGHNESDEDILLRLIKLHDTILKASKASSMHQLSILDASIASGLVNQRNKEPRSALPWSLEKKKKA